MCCYEPRADEWLPKHGVSSRASKDGSNIAYSVMKLIIPIRALRLKYKSCLKGDSKACIISRIFTLHDEKCATSVYDPMPFIVEPRIGAKNDASYT